MRITPAISRKKGVESVALIDGSQLSNGVIECDIASATFSGLAFHAADSSTYECLYLRPFNSGTAKHENTVQYASKGVPGGEWKELAFDCDFVSPMHCRTFGFDFEFKTGPLDQRRRRCVEDCVMGPVAGLVKPDRCRYVS